MAFPASTLAARLLGALEDLAGREALLVRSGCYAEAMAIQQRGAPLMARLVELAGELEDKGRARGCALLDQRRATLAQLLARRTHLSAERQRLARARRQLTRVASYGRVEAPLRGRRLDAAV